mmetsp:Transcript_15517/g.49694  ORF Transcript_15517/g.49694 Transcript_15517/m.49694 type:complete len:1198 (-) Transcript_15517:59-3652(-)
MAHDSGEIVREHPGKRRRQQAVQLNIGDWSTQDYAAHFVNVRTGARGRTPSPTRMRTGTRGRTPSPTRMRNPARGRTPSPTRTTRGRTRSPSRPRAPPYSSSASSAAATAAVATVVATAPVPVVAHTPVSGTEGDAAPRRARVLQRVATSGVAPGASQQSTASSAGGFSKDQAGGSSDSDVDGRAGKRMPNSQRLAALLRPPRAAGRRSPAAVRRHRHSGGASGGRAGATDGGSTGSHSSSDEDGKCRVPGMRHPLRLMRDRASEPCTQVEQVEVDGSVDWNAVGGLRSQIDALKECVLHPLLYPELYDALGVVPPRGVLLHGPPGCGKTLAARALAGTCKGAGVRVAFFARKGGDIQSKFVGEAEQRLAALFEAARRNAPSIIFFDEIDGLAPSRSESGSEGTAHHNSVVATLLALMDGLVARGRVAVLGATNRPELLDAALRRPGRFDRELRFAPPAAEERLQILEVLTRHWPRASREVGGGASRECLQRLAFDRTAGLTGAELRALTAEAAIRSIRRTFPQLYASSAGRFQLSPDRIQVTEDDFESALSALAAPGARAARSAVACGLTSAGGEVPIAPLTQDLAPLLLEPLHRVQHTLAQLFPPWGGSSSSSSSGGRAAAASARAPARSAPPVALLGAHALVCDSDQQLLRLLEPALLWGCELPAFMISLDAALAAPDGAAAQLRRVVSVATAAAPSVLLVPRLERWASANGRGPVDTLGRSPATLLLRALQQIPFEAAVLVLGTGLVAHPTSSGAAKVELKRKRGLAFGFARARRRLRAVVSSSSPEGRAERMQQGKEPRRSSRTTWSRLLALFENVAVPSPGWPEAQGFLTGLLRRGMRALLDGLLEEQHLRAPLPELPMAAPESEDVQEERRLAEMPREELEREEEEDRFWLRLFRNQIRQVLQSLARYTRFAIFNQTPAEVQEAAPLDSLASVSGPVTLSELAARNDAHEYTCVEDLRADFKRIQENVQALFPDRFCQSQCRVRNYANELLDKAEAKLDCIDAEVVRALSKVHGRWQLRQAALRRRRRGDGADESSAGPAHRPLGRVEQRPGDLPLPLDEAVREAAGRLLGEHGADKPPQLSEVLEAGKRVQRSLFLALSPDPLHMGASKGSRSARALMKQLTDSFAGEYAPPECLDGLTASTLLARRCNYFQRWCKKFGPTARQLAADAVAALLREDRTLHRLQPMMRS